MQSEDKGNGHKKMDIDCESMLWFYCILMNAVKYLGTSMKVETWRVFGAFIKMGWLHLGFEKLHANWIHHVARCMSDVPQRAILLRNSFGNALKNGKNIGRQCSFVKVFLYWYSANCLHFNMSTSELSLRNLWFLAAYIYIKTTPKFRKIYRCGLWRVGTVYLYCVPHHSAN